MRRLGDNLYSSSVIALNPDTGKLRWHYQFSPHNEFDWDSTQVPVLADIEWQGTPRKVMMLANRNGMFYVLDRITGEFLKGKPFVKTNWAPASIQRAGRYRRRNRSHEGRTLVYPGNQGGTNWYPPSYSPKTGLFYIPTWENSSTTYIKGEEPPEFHEGQNVLRIVPKRRRPRRRCLWRSPRHRSEDRREEMGLPSECGVDGSRHPDHRIQRAVQRRSRRRVLCARCA